MAEELFSKIRNEFEKTAEEKRKVEQLRTIKQRGRTCNEYVQEFKKIAKENRYKKQPLIEKFKRRLNGTIKRKLVEAESLSSIKPELPIRSDSQPEQHLNQYTPLSIINFIQTITLGILDQFQLSKWPSKFLKKTFQMVPKTSQSNQYLPSYQQISQQLLSYQTLNY